jgi:hypothetical protein
MSSDDSFLARWSRRKRVAAVRERPPPETPVDDSAASAAARPTAPAAQPKTAVDLARLPTIDSIDAGSDLTPFLAPGVPADLARAALRRAWSADPAIRDFIGLSENSWDFAAPGGVPGFGSVTPEQVRTLLAQLTGEPTRAETAEARADSDPAAAAPAMEPVPEGFVRPACKDEQAAKATLSASQHDLIENVASQQEFAMPETFPPPFRRRHGGALPQ